MNRRALSLGFAIALIAAVTATTSARPLPPSVGSLPSTAAAHAAAARVMTTGVSASAQDLATGTDRRSGSASLPKGFLPAVVATQRLSRYFVVLNTPSVAQSIASAGRLGAAAQRQAKVEAVASQTSAVAQAQALGGKIVFRYSTLINGFSATLSASAADALRSRPDVASVQPVSIVVLDESEGAHSVGFIRAPDVWHKLGVRGQGMTLALVDTGIDYTHKDFGGPGTVAAYESNDPNFVESGTFPTKKVIGGFDFVGSNYDVLDDDATNDIPRPDFDPLDRDGHGSHTGGSCCGIGVPGLIDPGAAPRVKILAYKVWDSGDSTDDVLVAAYERAVDPNQDGDTSDHADVLSFSGGVDYGNLNSVEAVAAQRVVDLGTVFVAAAGNAGSQAAGGGNAYILGTPAAARGVIAVAASIDEVLANRVVINSPSGVSQPDGGVAVFQDWSGTIPAGLTHDIVDARQFQAPADSGGAPAASDRMLCDTTPAGSFAGKIALVYKGASGDGDCTGTEKVFRAQEMGASAVILWDGFGGFPFDLAPGDFVDQIAIPAVMLSTADSEALGDALSPSPPAWNSVTINATITEEPTPVPAFSDSMTDFTSEGPARLTDDLKPDITAPGADIVSAGVGTGDGAAVLSGTSMATPHVAGVAVLMRQIHPTWSPDEIKALMMNQARRKMISNDLSSLVPATVMGSGRVDAYRSAIATSLAWPGSLSFCFHPIASTTATVRSFQVRNNDTVAHHYDTSGGVRYSDFDPSIATIDVSLNGSSFGSHRSFSLAPGASRTVWVRLTLHPEVISEPEQEYGWYDIHPNLDGTIVITPDGPHHDTMRIAWHVVPLAVSTNGVSSTDLDLTGGPATFNITAPAAAGISSVDLYQLGTLDPVGSNGEEDIVAVGVRSFTGATIDGNPHGLPSGTDAFGGFDWTDFLTNDDAPTEPVEFVVQSAGLRNTTRTMEVDIKIDDRADGVFADPALQADYLIVKPPDGGNVCVYDLSLPSPFDACSAFYFADYSIYDNDLTGLAVDASAIGLSTAHPRFSYQVTSCTGRFSGDVPGTFCDSAGEFDGTTWDLVFNPINPPLAIDHQICQGFFHGPACDAAHPVHVSVGSAAPGADPSILVILPNGAPSRDPIVITTHT